MIERITLINFQIHQKITIDFDPNVTTIVGESDKGKTAILRALGWVCFGKPAGMGFITHGRDRCKVRLVVDGRTVLRTRGRKTPAVYKLGVKVFKAMAGAVPPEIAELLNVNDLNFQTQLASPFWMLESPGQVSKNLNSIVNLEDIDRSLSAIASRVRTAKVTTEVTEARVKELKAAIARLEWVEDLCNDLEALQKLRNRVETQQKRRQEASECLKRAKTLQKRRRALEGAIESAAGISATATRLVKTGKQIQELYDLTRQVWQLRKRLGVRPPRLDGLLEASEAINKARQRIQNINDDVGGLRMLLMKIQTLEYQFDHWDTELKTAQDEVKKLTKGNCPLCNQPMGDNHVQHEK